MYRLEVIIWVGGYSFNIGREERGVEMEYIFFYIFGGLWYWKYYNVCCLLMSGLCVSVKGFLIVVMFCLVMVVFFFGGGVIRG